MESAEKLMRQTARGLDADGIADLYRRTYANARQARSHQILDCPSCGEIMFEREWTYGSQVRADVCMNCRGVWLDEGELDDLARFLGATWT
jgi:Transcription factor zinc-finger